MAAALVLFVVSFLKEKSFFCWVKLEKTVGFHASTLPFGYYVETGFKPFLSKLALINKTS
jgi:hypothetical protein